MEYNCTGSKPGLSWGKGSFSSLTLQGGLQYVFHKVGEGGGD